MMVLRRLILLCLCLGLGATGALVAGWVWLSATVQAPGPGSQDTEFTIQRGEGLGGIIRRLAEDELISATMPVRLYARVKGLESGLQAGTYVIPAGASADMILQQFLSGDVKTMLLTIPEGLTTTQILRRVEAADMLTGDLPPGPFEEGIFLPDTYSLTAGTTRGAFLDRMQQAQLDLLAQLWSARDPDVPLATPQDAVILASIVEKETGIAGERDLIAGLFTARLNRGMRLESDPTIIYGISKGEPLYNRQGQRRTLYRSEINRRTDWNTYQIDGLPRTPICNPGREALAAVLNPAPTDYIFFVADGQGGHLFAETYAEHQRNVAAYRRYEREEIAREREAP